MHYFAEQSSPLAKRNRIKSLTCYFTLTCSGQRYRLFSSLLCSFFHLIWSFFFSSGSVSSILYYLDGFISRVSQRWTKKISLSVVSSFSEVLSAERDACSVMLPALINITNFLLILFFQAWKSQLLQWRLAKLWPSVYIIK